jgi:GNAT superfamily N-acetyltransferase
MPRRYDLEALTRQAMDLALKTRYWEDLQARSAFISFIKAIHNVDFTAWDAAGYWDDDYIPFSYFAGDRVVANVCIYTMPAIVNGEKCRIAQVSGVGTLPEFRLKGLARKLHEIALHWAFKEHRFAFLFADTEAMPFYAKVGFRPAKDFAPFLSLAGTAPKAGLAKLDLRNPSELEAVYALACERAAISSVLANFNPKLLMYHVIYALREHSYRIADLDTVIFLKRAGSKIVLYDVLARDLSSFEELYPYLSSGTDEIFEFRFPTDRLKPGDIGLRELQGSNLHVMGETGLDRHVVPFTAHA